MTKIYEGQRSWLTTIFPSASDPKSIQDAVFNYECGLIKCGKKIDTSELMGFENYSSFVRIYKDIFLAYDTKTKSWVLLRIHVP